MDERIIKARQMLFIDDFSNINKRYHRILQTDPLPFYERLGDRINPYKRHNWITKEMLFPLRDDKICACGCEQPVTGRRSRWASQECVIFTNQVYLILYGKSDFIKILMNEVYDYRCCKCGRCSDDFPRKESKNCMWITPIHLEHTLAVQNGGGGCWVSNFTFMCVDCHKIKTKQDRYEL